MKFLPLAILCLISGFVGAAECDKKIYLTFDTGNMSVAEHVASVLERQQVKATFFLANEKTMRGDYSLDDSWQLFWTKLVKQGHVFGSHTIDHTYFQKDLPNDRVLVKSQFGTFSGRPRAFSSEQLCKEINAVDERFHHLTGQHISKLWRAPGGKVSDQLLAMGQVCGYKHVAWSKAGFMGDELSSKLFTNEMLLTRAINTLRSGDITMAHLGIWSRKDPWAPAVLEPMIIGLKKKGFCFATIESEKS